MNYLKRSQGIDYKAKDSGIHGKLVIQMRDPLTKKIKEEIRHENFLTQALSSLYNSCPYGLNSKIRSNSSNSIPYQVPPYKTALGGILVFPNSLGDSVSDYYPSLASNYPTGYASMINNDQADPKQGLFDEYGSQLLDNGYVYLYTWSSLHGNGPIGAVALSHANCYKYFSGDPVLLGSLSVGRYYNYGCAIGMNSKGIYFAEVNTLNSGKIKFIPYSKSEIELVNDTLNITSKYVSDYEFENTNRTTQCAVTETEIHVFSVTSYDSGLNQSNLRHTTITLADGSYTTENITVPEHIAGVNTIIGDVGNDSCHTVAFDGTNVYMAKYGFESIIKIPLANPANLTEYAMPTGYNCCQGSSYVGGKIYIASERNYTAVTVNNILILGEDGIVRVGPEVGHWRGSAELPHYQSGVWAMSAGAGEPHIVGKILTTYCATKANLAEPTEKTASIEMIIQYQITQV